MKFVRNVLRSAVSVAFFFAMTTFAAESNVPLGDSSLISLSLTTDFAWYPKYEFKTGDDHFSGVSFTAISIPAIMEKSESVLMETL